MDHPHLRSRRLGAILLLVAMATAGLVACSNSSSRDLVGATTTSSTTPVVTEPDREPLLQVPPGFHIPDTRSAVLQKAESKALPPPIPVRGGDSVVSGTVTGPDGGVGRATVLIERFVGTQSGSIVAFTDSGGRFNVTSLLGGRYRARAWLKPSLATLDSPTGFVADGDHLSLQIGVERHDAVTLQVASSVTALTVGVASGVNGLLTQESVDDQGIIHTVGVGGISIALTTPGPLTIDLPNPAVTGADGRIQWRLTCVAPGTFPVTATVATTTAAPPGAPVAPAVTGTTTLPNCAVPLPPTTTTTTSTTTSSPP